MEYGDFDKDKVFDPVMYEEILINKMQNDADYEDYVFFYTKGKPMAFIFPHDQLIKMYNDYSSIFAVCNTSALNALHIDKVNPNNLYFRFNVDTTYFIPLNQIIHLLSTNHKKWLLTDTGFKETFTSSILNIYDNYSSRRQLKIGIGHNSGEVYASMMGISKNPIDIVGSDHCQDDSDKNIYSITPIEFIELNDKKRNREESPENRVSLPKNPSVELHMNTSVESHKNPSAVTAINASNISRRRGRPRLIHGPSPPPTNASRRRGRPRLIRPPSLVPPPTNASRRGRPRLIRPPPSMIPANNASRRRGRPHLIRTPSLVPSIPVPPVEVKRRRRCSRGQRINLMTGDCEKYNPTRM